MAVDKIQPSRYSTLAGKCSANYVFGNNNNYNRLRNNVLDVTHPRGSSSTRSDGWWQLMN